MKNPTRRTSPVKRSEINTKIKNEKNNNAPGKGLILASRVWIRSYFNFDSLRALFMAGVIIGEYANQACLLHGGAKRAGAGIL